MSKAGVDGLSLEHDRQPIARDPSAGSGRPAAPSVGVNRDTEQLAPTLKKEKLEIPPREIPPRGASPVKRGGTWKRVMYASTAVVLVAGGVGAWLIFSKPALPPGFAGGNGRLEANEIYVATKYPGRIQDVLFNEGDTVEAGQVVARMDTSALEAQLRQALAQITEAQDSRNTALAQVDVKQADHDYAAKQDARSKQLVTTGAISGQEAEVDAARMAATGAELVGAKAEATRSLSSIAAARATADRLRAEIKDAVLVAPLRARIETRLAEPGEVLGAGGRVFSLNDLSDVYMYIFLPTEIAGKVAVGSEGRIVLDAAPQYPIRTIVSFVSPISQFTPKAVETAEERYNLTFRVKLQLDKQRLREFEPFVKSGLPGMGYVRFDPNAQWPANLEFKSVPANLLGPAAPKGAN
jgi:HlyD family secretion protein